MSAKISTSIAARMLGLNADTILKYRRLGKIKSGERSSKAPQAPWLYDREEIVNLKNASHPQPMDAAV